MKSEVKLLPISATCTRYCIVLQIFGPRTFFIEAQSWNKRENQCISVTKGTARPNRPESRNKNFSLNLIALQYSSSNTGLGGHFSSVSDD